MLKCQSEKMPKRPLYQHILTEGLLMQKQTAIFAFIKIGISNNDQEYHL